MKRPTIDFCLTLRFRTTLAELDGTGDLTSEIAGALGVLAVFSFAKRAYFKFLANRDMISVLGSV
jgi:hypothetical protein